VPDGNRAAQRPGQAIPCGELVTVPCPRIETAGETSAGAKVADTYFGASIVSGQSSEPEQAPVQRRNREPAAAAACRTTRAPCSHGIEQAPGQEIPGRSLATVPVPLPIDETASCAGSRRRERHHQGETGNQRPAHIASVGPVLGPCGRLQGA